MNNMDLYNRFAVTPREARKEITAGRLKGFTDINPMWRIKMLTDIFGAAGQGWKCPIVNKTIMDGAEGEKKAFVDVKLYYRLPNGEWSEGIDGTGGSAFVSKEKGGLYTDDECFKKAYTDAIGVACKALGMSADIYFANDRTKYTSPADETMPGASKGENYIPTCAGCGQVITPAEHDYSVKRYGKPLCRSCQKKA